MKKIITLLLTLFVLSSGVYAYNYTAEDKKEMYDAFEQEFFNSMSNELISQGFQQNSVYAFTEQLKLRYDRNSLENASWACISKYEPEQLGQNIEGVTKECFTPWVNKYIESNIDLAQKYLAK